MQASNAPTKSAVPFANSGAKNTIPVASQIGITPGLASFTDGFPPLTMTPLAAGGVPPYGQDFNGILNFLSAAVRWDQAGALYQYDTAFSTAIGGYPKGAMLASSDNSRVWISTIDNNVSNPDAGGGGWATAYSPLSASYEIDVGPLNAYQVAYSPGVPQISDGMVLRFRASNTNTGTSTFSPNGLPPKPIQGANRSGLIEGGEIVAGGLVTLQYSIAANGGTGAWIIVDAAAGALQLPNGTYAATLPTTDASRRVANMATVQAMFAAYSAAQPVIAYGQCRLSRAGESQLVLSPYAGNLVTVSGVPRVIPAVGVRISNAGLAVSTLYYVYLYMSGSSLALELSLTGHTTGATGVEEKSGDPTRTLVGMIYTDTGGNFGENNKFVGILNWFNRRALQGNMTISNVSSTSTSISELTASARIIFLSWGDEAALVQNDGEYSGTASGGSMLAAEYVDGVRIGGLPATSIGSSGNGYCYTAGSTVLLSEGVHTATIYALTSSGTVTFLSTSHKVLLRG